MLEIDNSFLRSKFSRRIFLLFIVSAVIPVTLIALLSYTQISSQFTKQSYEQSRIACKAIGMELYRRLTVAHNELASIGKILSGETPAGKDTTARSIQRIAPNFDELTLLSIDGKKSYLRGKLEQVPELDAEQRQQLARGKTIIQTQIGRESQRDILFIQSLNHNNAANSLLIGKVDPDFIWAVHELVPPTNDLLIINPTGMILKSSRQSLQLMLPALTKLLASSISGHLNWSLDGEQNNASYWSIFTQDLFASPNLIVVVSQPAIYALDPIKSFSTIYVPLLVLTILGISFIAARQIRKKLVPLAILHSATQKIASGNFSEHIHITSDDEFAALGNAFNVMAGHLDTQFTSLATMAEIDRLILSSFDVRFIISTVLGRVGELTPCSAAAILELDENEPYNAKLSLRRNSDNAPIEEHQIRLTHDDIRRLHNNPSHLECNIEPNCPLYLKTFIDDGSQAVLIPTFIKDRLSTVVIFVYSQTIVNHEELNSLRKFANHVAVALSNAVWEERLYHQAHYDSLTKLPNRALLHERLEHAISQAQNNHSNVGVLFLDLDRFKLVNDSLGHAAGDVMLKKIAEILLEKTRSIDTVARFGGDEFVILIPDIDNNNDLEFALGTIATKIFKAAQNEFAIERQIIHPKMSIGIARYPKDGLTSDELIKNADTAMYQAKSKGRARYEFFTPELNRTASYRLQLEQDLRHALANNEFILHYQPKVDCHNGNLLGAEALIRWMHPQRGIISPLEFIGLAEETGLIRDIGEWVIKDVCRQIVEWHAAGFDPAPIAVNVSAQQFQDDNFTHNVAEILSLNRLEPGMLELEITETTVMGDAEESITKLNKFQDMGLRISLDDFGTGYSSLSYLRRLPIHTLKIDQSFIASFCKESDTRAIVDATIILAHKLGLKVVAEGVETEEQKRLLQDMRCDALQGYLFSKPLTAELFAKRFLIGNSQTGAQGVDALGRLGQA
jgi:diguanylate cyclase (GGDEF)-like protein